MNRIFESANDLDDATQTHIETNNAKIAEWVRAHPGEELNTARVEEILNAPESGPQQFVGPETDYTHDANHEWRRKPVDKTGDGAAMPRYTLAHV